MSIIGDVVAGVSNLVSRVKLIADQVMDRVTTFISRADPYINKVSSVITAAEQFGDCSRDLKALADIEEPLVAEHLPVITSPSTTLLLGRVENAIDVARSTVDEAEKTAELAGAKAGVTSLGDAVRALLQLVLKSGF